MYTYCKVLFNICSPPEDGHLMRETCQECNKFLISKKEID